MSSYSEWLGRKLQNEKKYLDTRPHRDAGHHTEVVKRLAVATLAERPTGKPVVEASTYTDYVGGVGLRTGTRANTKAPQITQICTSVQGVDTRYPSPAYTNSAVLAGLGKAKLANCCSGCGKAYDSLCLGCCGVRLPAGPIIISGTGWKYAWFQNASGGDPTITAPSSWGSPKDVSDLATYPKFVPFNGGSTQIIPYYNASSEAQYDFTVLHITGYILAPTTGTYQFVITSDDGTAIRVNGTLLYDSRVSRGNMMTMTVTSGTTTSTIDLVAGTYYPFEVLWANGQGGLQLKINYTINGGSELTDIGTLAYH